MKWAKKALRRLTSALGRDESDGSDSSPDDTPSGGLVAALDRSWSGRGGRRYYHGPSRDVSQRAGLAHPANGGAAVPLQGRLSSYHYSGTSSAGQRPAAVPAAPRVVRVAVAGNAGSPAAGASTALMRRVSSSPCLVVSAPSQPANRQTTKDSASSVTAPGLRASSGYDDDASAAPTSPGGVADAPAVASASSDGTPRGVSLLSRQLRPEADTSSNSSRKVSGEGPARPGPGLPLPRSGLSTALQRSHEPSHHGGTHGLPTSPPERLLSRDQDRRTPGDPIGSWAERVTNYSRSQGGRRASGRAGAGDSARASPPADTKGGRASAPLILSTHIDPTELALALQSLDTAGASHPDTQRRVSGSISSPRQAVKIVGDPDWRFSPLHLDGAVLPIGAGTSAPARPGDVVVGSWSAAGMLAAAAESLPIGRGEVRGGASSFGELEAAAATAAAAPDGIAREKDWNRRFVRRWREVRRRAHLQAIGLRSLWRVSSPGQHANPELLLDNPALDTVPPLICGAANSHGAWSSRAGGVGMASKGGAMHRDPSLATMLRGEVAEVC